MGFTLFFFRRWLIKFKLGVYAVCSRVVKWDVHRLQILCLMRLTWCPTWKILLGLIGFNGFRCRVE